MVSALSARLVAGYSSGSLSEGSKAPLKVLSSKDRNDSKPNAEFNSKTEKVTTSQGGVSGYSADNENSTMSGFPPSTIGMLSRGTRREAKGYDREAKRMKLAEQNYAAANVKKDLELGGKTFPELRANCPRTLPTLSGVGVSRVSHMFSKDFKVSEPTRKSDPHDYYFSVAQLGEACRSFYNDIPKETRGTEDGPVPNVGSEAGSTTSSFTDESDDPGMTMSKASGSSSARDSAPSLIAMGDSVSIGLLPLGTMGERSAGSEARLVALSFPPFTIIHANAVYVTMTGRPSKSILGKPLREVFSAKEFSSAMASVDDGDDKTSALMDLSGRVLKTKSVQSSKLRCQMKVSRLSTEYYSVAG